ncbi:MULTISPECIES: hypothetical protein [unclassified Synechocystis]|nr:MULTISPECIES: hypothetical protein [unclassified Synechocystis]AIE73823.1 hypothetical protein D082_12950 [Synechocystis sp. PCC 6714]
MVNKVKEEMAIAIEGRKQRETRSRQNLGNTLPSLAENQPSSI